MGVSGWRYPPWRGEFYPEGLAQRRELEYASRTLLSIELNGSFYSLQRPESYARWYAETPAGFVFSVKGPRYITHMLRLRDVATPLANFFASGVANLREKLGPFLWQLPPSLEFDPASIEAFLSLLPRDTDQASALARRHNSKVKGRAKIAFGANRPLRHALEVRHESFVVAGFTELLRKHRVAFVVADTAGKWPEYEDVTADFVYIRLHGAHELYVSGYSDAMLDRWSKRIRLWSAGGEPRDARRISRRPAEHAPRNARKLMHKLGLRWP
ncbi:MAG: hypothetical protein AUH79_05965 [Betaproteobacteria bacterium 13_1_40CM_4_64_4]|nr:MAG: hypothetical protein AUH79_05965 [Betaproteobacteria bacterium 13_1_40CM_4_64_4]